MELLVFFLFDLLVWVVLLGLAPFCLRGRSPVSETADNFGLYSALPEGFTGW